MSLAEQQPRLNTAESANPGEYFSERDEHLGELFRSFLPEEIADLPFDSLLMIATECQGSQMHTKMVKASVLFNEVVQREVRKEINERKKGLK